MSTLEFYNHELHLEWISPYLDMVTAARMQGVNRHLKKKLEEYIRHQNKGWLDFRRWYEIESNKPANRVVVAEAWKLGYPVDVIQVSAMELLSQWPVLNPFPTNSHAPDEKQAEEKALKLRKFPIVLEKNDDSIEVQEQKFQIEGSDLSRLQQSLLIPFLLVLESKNGKKLIFENKLHASDIIRLWSERWENFQNQISDQPKVDLALPNGQHVTGYYFPVSPLTGLIRRLLSNEVMTALEEKYFTIDEVKGREHEEALLDIVLKNQQIKSMFHKEIDAGEKIHSLAFWRAVQEAAEPEFWPLFKVPYFSEWWFNSLFYHWIALSGTFSPHQKNLLSAFLKKSFLPGNINLHQFISDWEKAKFIRNLIYLKKIEEKKITEEEAVAILLWEKQLDHDFSESHLNKIFDFVQKKMINASDLISIPMPDGAFKFQYLLAKLLQLDCLENFFENRLLSSDDFKFFIQKLCLIDKRADICSTIHANKEVFFLTCFRNSQLTIQTLKTITDELLLQIFDTNSMDRITVLLSCAHLVEEKHITTEEANAFFSWEKQSGHHFSETDFNKIFDFIRKKMITVNDFTSLSMPDNVSKFYCFLKKLLELNCLETFFENGLLSSEDMKFFIEKLYLIERRAKTYPTIHDNQESFFLRSFRNGQLTIQTLKTITDELLLQIFDANSMDKITARLSCAHLVEEKHITAEEANAFFSWEKQLGYRFSEPHLNKIFDLFQKKIITVNDLTSIPMLNNTWEVYCFLNQLLELDCLETFFENGLLSSEDMKFFIEKLYFIDEKANIYSTIHASQGGFFLTCFKTGWLPIAVLRKMPDNVLLSIFHSNNIQDVKRKLDLALTPNGQMTRGDVSPTREEQKRSEDPPPRPSPSIVHNNPLLLDMEKFMKNSGVSSGEEPSSSVPIDVAAIQSVKQLSESSIWEKHKVKILLSVLATTALALATFTLNIPFFTILAVRMISLLLAAASISSGIFFCYQHHKMKNQLPVQEKADFLPSGGYVCRVG